MENSMTERNAKDDRTKLQLPKNIRQIGNVQGAVRIYMEDYVYTYLHGNGRNGWGHRGSVFVGTRCQENGQKYLFISGLVQIPDECFRDGVPEFTDLMWAGIYQEMKCFYDGVEILGWGMDVAGASERLTGSVDQLHRRAFHGQDRFAFFMDSLEKEEAFYVYEKNTLRRRDGYYVYYEKNPQMREYMLQGRTTDEPTEIDPQLAVVTNYRERTAKKDRRSRGIRRAVYVASLLLLVTVSAAGVSQMTNAGRIHRLEETVAFLKADKQPQESGQTGSRIPSAGLQTESAIDTIDDTAAKTDETTETTSEPKTPAQTAEDDSSRTAETQKKDEAAENDDRQESVEVQENDELKTAQAQSQEKSDKPQETGTADTGAAEDAQTAETMAGEKDYYVVQQGESLLGISQKLYGKNYTKELCELNELEDENKIYAGQTLLLLDK